MTETAVLFALEQVFQLLKEETNLLRGVHNDFSDIKDELESIQAILKDADSRAADEADTNNGIRTWLIQLREASFRIEDVIDEYLWVMRGANHPGCGALLCKIASLIKTLIPRHHQIASEIQDIKVTVRGIKERSERYNFQILHEQGSNSNTRGTEDGRWCDPRLASLFIEETEIVGFEFPRDELVGWLLEGTAERSVISVVGMGGIGKTTLAKHVFDSQKVRGHFDCCAFITVSQSYTVRGLLIDMVEQFCMETKDPLPQMLNKMDEKSLVTELRQYLQHRRYLIFFDDVWQEGFSDQVEFSMPNNNKGSRIIITTRMLKACILYFGIYPEDYSINHKRLTRQWIAEGFVKSEERRTLEQVAKEYLSELIHRSLVQVSKIGVEGKVQICQVHDLLREVIIRKMKDLSFCHFVHEEDVEPVAVGITRRLCIATSSNNVLKSTSNSFIRAVHVFEEGGFPELFTSKFRILKVLDFEGTSLNYVPNNLGNFFHLRYINLRNTKVQVLPKSVGNLQNLETLDIRKTLVHELPSEINKLTKLRHLLAFHRNYDGDYSILGFTTGVLIQKGIKNLTSLQNLYYVEVDHGGIDLIQEMRMLRKLRKLGLRHVRREYGNALCASVVEMKYLESLNITAIAEDEIIDLNSISSPPQLRRLHLKVRLEKLPEWIPKLEFLFVLRLGLSRLKDDPLKSLQNLPNLVRLFLWDNAYDGEILHFQYGGFPKLKDLDISRMDRVNSILIDKRALHSLELFNFNKIPHLKEAPSGIKHLDHLKVP